jgi:mono/diheme cytochrome c family protein
MRNLTRRTGSARCRRAAALMALGLSVAPLGEAAMAADAAHGEQLAKRWCASCHIVAADQTRGADNVPAFASIAKIPGFNAKKIARFLMDPHPKMPDMQRGRGEAGDLAAYITSLAQ